MATATESDSKTVKVVFMPSGRRGTFPINTPILQAARQLGVDLDSVCGGRGICGRCQVVPAFGEFSKHGIRSAVAHVSAFSAVEERYKAKRGLAAERRLGCSCQLLGDVVVDVPADSQVHKQVVRKRAEVRAIDINPLCGLYYVEVERPDMHKPSGDLQRLISALAEQWQITIDSYDVSLLPNLQKDLRADNWQVTCAIRDGNKLCGVWSGFHDKLYGLAVDVGSTTMSVHICDLNSGEVVYSTGGMNPQIRFGEDLMSRVSYVMLNEGGEQELTAAVRTSLAQLIATACSEANIDGDTLMEAVLVGNPVMHHLLLGVSPLELGWAPFALVTNEAVSLSAHADLGLPMHRAARAWFLPCVAGHVGADAAAVILSETPYNRSEVSLLIDIGTNAEIIYGNKERLLACSSPTGPALEGAQISCGQRAANGAIERVRIDPDTLEPRIQVIGCEEWSDSADFASLVKHIGVTGICGSGIIEVLGEMFLAGLLTCDGIIDGTAAARTDRIVAEGRVFAYILHRGEPEIRITQADIRAIQLAKAALYAGCQLLIDKFGKTPERIVLAGAFGNHIDTRYAMLLGLIPDCPIKNVQSAGNAAGTGARIALLNGEARSEITTTIRRIEKIETAIEAKFQQYFVEAMAFPHKTHATPHLQKIFTLPNPPHPTSTAHNETRSGRRRRSKPQNAI